MKKGKYIPSICFNNNPSTDNQVNYMDISSYANSPLNLTQALPTSAQRQKFPRHSSVSSRPNLLQATQPKTQGKPRYIGSQATSPNR